MAASDPQAGGVYVLDARTGAWRTLVAPGKIRSPQGLAAAPDGKSVFVADYARGVARVSIPGPSLSWLETPADLVTTGVDGLAAVGDWLVVIQNGVEPHRVVAWRVERFGDLQDRVASWRTLVRGHAAFDEPTLGTVVGSDFVFVANSQYRHFKRDGTLDTAAMKEPVVLRAALPR